MSEYGSAAPERRRLSVEGAWNVRDLGGYAAAGGQSTRWRRFYRADGLHRLTAQGQEELLSRGVRTIIDLRHDGEATAQPNVFAGSPRVAYHRVSLVNPATTSRPDVTSLGHLYVGMLDGVQDGLRTVFELLAAEPAEPVLFHCAAGKDRTGVVAGLLLALAGAAREDIVRDYALTAACIAPILEELRAGRPEQVPAEMYERFLECGPEHMERMLDHLEGKYGGAERYLLEIGMEPERVNVLKRKLTSAIG